MTLSPEAYDKHKEAVAERYKDASAKARDIGDIPKVIDQARRDKCEHSLRLFCETYLSEIFSLAWSDDHLEVISVLEQTVLTGGKFALAMPRGSGKTQLSFAAALWAMLYGHRKFLVCVGATAEAAQSLIESLKITIETNELLEADFPEVCYPIRKLGGIGQRTRGQTCNGRSTRILWTTDELNLPDVPGAASAGAVCIGRGIGSSVRGLQHALPNGTTIRPDIAICDDLQTDESAHSIAECARRERTLTGAVSRLAGPGQTMSIVVPCTVIAKGDLADRLLDPKQHPEFRGRLFKLLASMPENMGLWEQYRAIRAESLQQHGDIRDATDFYRANQPAMDKGAVASWPARYEPGQLSGIQFGMDVWSESEQIFYAEFQNEPIQEQTNAAVSLKAELICERTSGIPRGVVPDWANHLTAFVDVQGNSLWWTVVAWDNSLRGHIVDYGVFPEQGHSNYLALRDIRIGLQDAFPGTFDQALELGLKALCQELLTEQYYTQTGSDFRSIDIIGIDANWHQSSDVVYAVARQLGAGKILPYHGRAISATGSTLDKWRSERGDRRGPNWLLQKGRRKQTHLVADVNAWKSIVADRLVGAVGDSSITLPDGKLCLDLADNLASEYAVEVESKERRVHEWKLLPGRDNHFWDGLVGCAVLASTLGASAPGQKPTIKPKSTRVRGSEKIAQRRANEGTRNAGRRW